MQCSAKQRKSCVICMHTANVDVLSLSLSLLSIRFLAFPMPSASYSPSCPLLMSYYSNIIWSKNCWIWQEPALIPGYDQCYWLLLLICSPDTWYTGICLSDPYPKHNPIFHGLLYSLSYKYGIKYSRYTVSYGILLSVYTMQPNSVLQMSSFNKKIWKECKIISMMLKIGEKNCTEI